MADFAYIATLNGLLQPQAGRIAVGSNALDDLGSLREHRLRTSTIFQEHALIDRLSALDNVLLAFAEALALIIVLLGLVTLFNIGGANIHCRYLHVTHPS
jgi:ABC-type phosphate/phosphonate transport system ATPase subunit